jgi:uncharacterized repeat protein (TIGR01451 family)
MKSKVPLRLLLTLAFFLSSPLGARAEHRATRLGNPAFRFAPPLHTPEDLRARFQSEALRPDIAEILRQWGWTGDLADLHAAAQRAEITEVRLPYGTRMPFMSSREKGRPVCLKDVVWVGSEPVEAYAFNFASKGRRYRCVTPKPCSNFYLEDLGVAKPELLLVKSAPAEAGVCAPFELKLIYRNTGGVPATQVRLVDRLPAGWKTTNGASEVALDLGTLQPGQGREVRLPVLASRAGSFTNQARLTCAEGIAVEATAVTTLLAPALALDCAVPAQVFAGRPLNVCLTIRNTGDGAEAKAVAKLPVPEGATFVSATEGGTWVDGAVVWELTDLAPGAAREVCARLSRRELGPVNFKPTVQGVCGSLVESACASRIAGIAAILLEVVDLEDPIQVEQDVTYEIRVTNQGSATGTNLRLRCNLPASQQFVTGSGSTSMALKDGTLNIEPLPSLEAKGVATWRVVVKALAADDARFQVDLISDQFEQPIHENESTQQY